jgi:hypothetical protein
MAIQVVTDHRPETQMTDVYIYEVQTDPLTRRVLTTMGAWQEAGPAGIAVQPTYSIPDNVLALVVNALGVPMSDTHMLDALRHERGRVDNFLERMTEAVTRGL